MIIKSRTRVLRFSACLIALGASTNILASSHASDHATVAAAGEGTGEIEQADRTDLLDLGPFRIRGCRTTDQEIVDIKFGVQLILSTKTNAADHHRLGSWKNRFRDQVIIAVRSAAPEDFADPALQRIQRIMLFRAKRLPTGVGVIGLYLTNFSLDEGETLQDLMVPAVMPAAPKKPAPSGAH
jgi:hypothetical protein